MLKLLIHVAIATVLSLLSTFLGERTARAIYPDIMSCETGCNVVATGWPFVFVRDYLGMSVGNRADITEVWFAADRFDWGPFLLNVVAWTASSIACYTIFRRFLAERPCSSRNGEA